VSIKKRFWATGKLSCRTHCSKIPGVCKWIH